MIAAAWYAVCGFCAIVGLSNLRAGIYLGILLDVLRDPVRKLAEGEPLLITLAGASVWAAVIVHAVISKAPEIRRMFRQYRRLRTALACLLLALIPAAILSCILYRGGYILAVIGTISYVAPICGIAVGYMFCRSEMSAYRLFAFYSILNAIALIGVPLEYLGTSIPALGGLQGAEWIRYRQGYTVDLMTGFYRSPDIMGLHAAHVIMFSLMLAIRRRRASRLGWIVVAGWASYCVLLSGRRKMLGIPLVFLAAFVAVAAYRGVRRFNRAFVTATVAFAATGAVALIAFMPDETSEHAEYATTLFTEGPTRASSIVVGSSVSTLQQVGVLGAGLGTATQGRHHAGIRTTRETRGWQEDGVSRLIVEFGVPGAVLMLIAALTIVGALLLSLRLVPRWSSIQILQIALLAVVCGNAASFAISHQQFSGDPVSALVVTVLAGIILSGPRLEASRNPVSHPSTVPEPIAKHA